MGFGNRNPGHITIRHCVAHSNGTVATVQEGPGAVRPVVISPGGNVPSEFWRLRVSR